MPFLKNPFGSSKGKNPSPATPVRSISVAPGQSDAEKDANRQRMEQELAASRVARESQKTEGNQG